MNILRKIKRNIFPAKPIDRKSIVTKGYADFLETGKTTNEAYMAALELYCATNGGFADEFQQNILLKNEAVKKENVDSVGILKNTSSDQYNEYNNVLNKDGYILFEQKVPIKTLEALTDFALKTKSVIPPAYDEPILYNPEEPKSPIYRFAIPDLVNNTTIQQLIMDESLINIARNYLGCEPIFDFPAMWWSTSFSKEASDEAAQLYHFDFDRIKWLKIFIYVNDVNDDNGPHAYIKGSHKTGAKPQHLLDRGYVRIPDKDLLPYYEKENLIKLCASAGTIFAGDTKCWHKGNNLKKGDRLVLEFQYTTSLFGANYPDMIIENPSEEFRSFCNKNKVYASNITLS